VLSLERLARTRPRELLEWGLKEEQHRHKEYHCWLRMKETSLLCALAREQPLASHQLRTPQHDCRVKKAPPFLELVRNSSVR
jgi:hypothetical protein